MEYQIRIFLNFRSLRNRKESAAGGETEVEKESSEEETPKEKEQRLPLIINASILLIFCMFGGVTYIAAGYSLTFQRISAFFSSNDIYLHD